jgi:fructose-1,6-bisphosphatase I
VNSISLACKMIAAKISQAGLCNLYGMYGNTNATGDEQKKLDVLSNEIFKNCLISTMRVCILASEEDEEPIICEKSPKGKYMVVFDPLDGSSNIDSNGAIGTIFGIYKRTSAKDQKPTK